MENDTKITNNKKELGNWIVLGDSIYIKLIDLSCIKYRGTVIPVKMLNDFFGVNLSINNQDEYKFKYISEGHEYSMSIVKAKILHRPDPLYRYWFEDDVKKRVKSCSVGKDVIIFGKNNDGIITIDIRKYSE